jgi:alpha-glucosidase
MLLLTLRGTPTLYYGDEIGLPCVPIDPDRVRDPFEKNVPGIGVGRDGSRTPMQWNTDSNAGFTNGEPWLPLDDAWRIGNVEVMGSDPSSIFSLYRKLLHLRRERKALSQGVYGALVTQGDVLLYIREWGMDRLLIALNFAATPATVSIGTKHRIGSILISDFGGREGECVLDVIRLRGNESLIVELERDVALTRSA